MLNKGFISKFLVGEKGGLLPFFAILIVGILGITALSIDSGQGLLVHRNTEDLADSMALAAVSALDGTQTGWQKAKRMALVTFNEGRIHSVDPNLFTSVNNFGPGVDNWETDANFRSSTINAGNGKIVVSIERGFYSYNNPTGNPEFHSLEGPGSDYLHLPKFFVANAVRVRVETRDLLTPIASVATSLVGGNFTKFDSIRGEATAVRDQDLEYPVVPVAIPACEFLADLNVESTNRYMSSGYVPSGGDPLPNIYSRQMIGQCQREVIAREPAAVTGPYIGNEKRVDGNLRSESYPRPALTDFTGNPSQSALCYSNPVNGLHINCKSMPIHASLGAPGTVGGASQALTSNDLLSSIAASRGANPSLIAKLGSPFNPMGDSSYLDDANISNEIGALINEGGQFRQVFYDALGDPEPNFPFRRNLVSTNEPGYTDPFAEMRLTWVTQDQGGAAEVAMLMGNSGDFHNTTDLNFNDGNIHLRYSNPMCHTDTVPFDDDVNARAKDVYVMLVASANQPYCDMSSQFGSNNPINATAPISPTRPVIVGFVRAHLFDYRTMEFARQDWWLAGPNDPNPADLKHDTNHDLPGADLKNDVLTDDNQFAYDSQFMLPAIQKYIQDSEVYAEDQADHLHCVSCDNNNFPSPECDVWSAQKSGTAQCPQAPGAVVEPPVPTWLRDCFGGTADVVDLLALLKNLQPHPGAGGNNPPPGGGGGGGSKPSCKEYCGAPYNMVGTSVDYGTRDVDWDGACYDDMMINGTAVCGRDFECLPSQGNYGGGAGAPAGANCPPLHTEIPSPPLNTGDTCNNLCAGVPAGFFNTCVGYCNSFVQSVPAGQAFQAYIQALDAIMQQFKIDLRNRYGNDLNNDGVRDGVQINSGGQPGAGNGAQWQPNLANLQYMSTNDAGIDVCLPRRVNDCFDMQDPNCWEDPRHRVSGWGCGGLRMRLSCDPNYLMSPKAFRDLRPALVSK